ncbi:MAG: class I SAM-dependent methyltransferase [Gemmataceae bacterium]|nr:class I SAM-dependent methyltransferase [Gemmataceae bacterium]
MTATPPAARPDYGLDAPGVVRNLFVAGAVALAAGAAASFGLIPAAFTGAWFAGAALTATGAWMVYSSKVGKVRDRERLLDRVRWAGGERVLDVGCGRGLMLIGAAKRLTAGKATGIDIWQAEDLSGNKPEATRENARREGVADRVEVTTGDMRQMPFPDGAFEVVVTSWAVHNLYAAAEREKAVREITRVLKPGGVALVKDIRHIGEYARAFEAGGCEVTRLTSPVTAVLAAVVTLGSLRPGVLMVRKGA